MNKPLIALAGCVIIGGAIAAVVTLRKPTPPIIVREPAPRRNVQPSTPTTAPSIAMVEPEASPLVAPSPAPATIQPSVSEPAPIAKSAAKPSRQLAQNNPKRSKQNPRDKSALPQPVGDGEKPIARQALALVGTDPAAEAIWFNAINDPNTSEHDRSDLIEDLNEDGFDDPKNPTPEELPLIESRMAIIEQLAPQSMDDVNAAAFAEAYKDLTNMRTRMIGQ